MDEYVRCRKKKKEKEEEINMSRSLKKGPYIDERLMQKIAASKPNDLVKTWSRSATITPEMVGIKFGVHNGKQFVEVQVVEDMVGHKLGEFAPTRTFRRHTSKSDKRAVRR